MFSLSFLEQGKEKFKKKLLFYENGYPQELVSSIIKFHLNG